MDTVRGRETWHTVFTVARRNSVLPRQRSLRSWIDTRTLTSLRFCQDIDEGSYEPKRHFEIFPDRREYIENEKPSGRASSIRSTTDRSHVLPAHDAAARRAGHVARTTTSGPIAIRFASGAATRDDQGARGRVRRDRRPADHQDRRALLRGRHAEIWLSDDENRIMLQMKSKVKIGSLNLYLKSYRPSPTTNDAAEPRSGPRRPHSARGGSLRRAHRSRRAAPEQGERRASSRIRRATTVRSRHSSPRCPTSSSRGISARSSTPSSTRRDASAASSLMLGGHVVKTGLAPLLIELMRRGIVTHVAMNGSARDSRLRDRALRRDVGGRRRRPAATAPSAWPTRPAAR